MITITHTQAEGTLIDGSEKGDGVLQIVRQHGFTWFPSIGRIGMRQSRDHLSNDYRINNAAAALRAAGHEVTVTIDNTPRDRAQVLAEQAARLDDRYDALDRKAARRAGEAAAAYQRADQLSQRFEGGQPILEGHHSERSARRDRKLMNAARERGDKAHREAERVADRAQAVGTNAAYSERPDVTARRIKAHESQLRIIDRDLAGHTRRHLDHDGRPFMVDPHPPATGAHRDRLLAERAHVEVQLAYDRAQLAAAVAEGRHIAHSKATLHVGDRVRWSVGSFYHVAKVNRVTVRVEKPGDPGLGGFNLAMTDIREVICPHTNGDTPTVIAPKPTPRTRRRERPDTTAGALDEARAAELTRAATVTTVNAVGFFPTPAALAARLVAELHLPGGAVTVLEPSAGSGSLVTAVLDANPAAHVVAVEPHATLAAMIDERAYVHQVSFDELRQLGHVDRVVMNPPFAAPGRALIWAEHITAAYGWLAPGGRLVAVAPVSFHYRTEQAAAELRHLVAAHGRVEALPDGSFTTAGTDVRTVMLVIDRPAEPAGPTEQLTLFDDAAPAAPAEVVLPDAVERYISLIYGPAGNDRADWARRTARVLLAGREPREKLPRATRATNATRIAGLRRAVEAATR